MGGIYGRLESRRQRNQGISPIGCAFSGVSNSSYHHLYDSSFGWTISPLLIPVPAGQSSTVDLVHALALSGLW